MEKDLPSVGSRPRCLPQQGLGEATAGRRGFPQGLLAGDRNPLSPLAALRPPSSQPEARTCKGARPSHLGSLIQDRVGGESEVLPGDICKNSYKGT